MHIFDILDLLDEGLDNQLKGSIGEMTVDYLLSQLDKRSYFHLNNVLLPLKKWWYNTN